jgi:hypothetical protein
MAGIGRCDHALERRTWAQPGRRSRADAGRTNYRTSRSEATKSPWACPTAPHIAREEGCYRLYNRRLHWRCRFSSMISASRCPEECSAGLSLANARPGAPGDRLRVFDTSDWAYGLAEAAANTCGLALRRRTYHRLSGSDGGRLLAIKDCCAGQTDIPRGAGHSFPKVLRIRWMID